MLLQRRRGSKADPITEDDVMRAIDKLKVLGGGFSVMKVGDTVNYCTCCDC
jgi:ESCRT-II complex subunit VPS22